MYILVIRNNEKKFIRKFVVSE
ncbi:MAG: hypothetical protein LBP67_10025 [Bacteroidales bacterium]|nr:hypothetical protein [Bacteroidales bacterium]MDR2085316.1 hypothetical protein [Bacteroidales bacterium]